MERKRKSSDGQDIERRREARIKVKLKAKIIAQLIGSNSKYDFETIDISSSGILLNFADSQRKPSFNMQSLLEIWLFHQNVEIFFFGKYVRAASDTSFAVKVSDIDDVNKGRLSKLLKEQLILGHSIDDGQSEDDDKD